MTKSSSKHSYNTEVLTDTPLRQGGICCPVCGTSFNYEFIDPGCYVAETSGLIMKPRLHWKRRVWSRTIPGLFYIIRCPECAFCGNSEAYISPVDDLNLTPSLLRRKISDWMRGGDPVCTVLWKELASQSPFVSGIINYLIAIRQLMCFDHVINRDSLRPGKYCLHLGWLLQDINRSGNPGEINDGIAVLQNKLGDVWPQAPLSDEAAIKMALEYYSNCYYLSDLPKRFNIEQQIMLLMVRLNLYLNNPRAAEDLVFKCLKMLNAELTEPRSLLKSSDPETQMMAQSRIMEINGQINETQQMLETVKHFRHITE